MARAGKVRNQTPKVEKQERQKKRQVGRAKKRLQYKKRIINVDPNDKRKKGPNFGAGKKVEETKWELLNMLHYTDRLEGLKH